MRKNKSALDAIDRRILDALQQNARISNVELADHVGLSASPCLERVKRLETNGVIQGYHAKINPHALGNHLLVFVEISLEYTSPTAFKDFKEAVSQLEQIQECHLVTGTSDHLLKARIKEMSEYRQLLGEMLARLPGIKASKSYVVMESIQENFFTTHHALVPILS